MKLILLTSSILLGIILGLYPRPLLPKPGWWKAFALTVVLVSSLVTIYTPLAGNFGDAEWTRSPAVDVIPIIIALEDDQPIKHTEDGLLVASAFNPSSFFEDRSVAKNIVISPNDYELLRNSESAIAEMFIDPKSDEYKVIRLAGLNPIIYFPANPALNQKIKNMNFHVPMSWVATLAFLIGAIMGVSYLRKGKYESDAISESSNFVGLAFASIAMVTGMVWAKFNWGMWWSNDPRQVSLAVLLLIYLAYFALRGSMPDSPKKYKISAVYSIISFVSAIFFLFVLPRVSPSLHPGGGSDEDLGPVVSFGEGILDSNLAIVYYFSLFGYILIYFWLTNLYSRAKLVHWELESIKGSND